MINLIYHFVRMGHYELFLHNDFRFRLREILSFMLDSYASGHRVAHVYTHSIKIFNFVDCWTPGWCRKAGPDGIWKNSKGIFSF